MKNIYRVLKRINNEAALKKYDPGMTPIDLGVLNNSYVPKGSIEKLAKEIYSGGLVPAAILEGMSGVINSISTSAPFVKYNKIPMNSVSGLQFKPGSLGTTNISGNINSGLSITTTPGTNPEFVAKPAESSLGGANEVAGQAAKAAAAIQSAKGVYDMYGLMTTNEGAGAQDMINAAGTSYVDRHGEQARIYDGLPPGLEKLKKDMVTSSTIKGAVAGMEMAELPADLLGPLGQLLKIPALGLGAVAGYFRGRHMKKELEKREREVKNAFTGYNRQSEAEAANKGIQNEFYNKHYSTADCGKNPIKKYDLGLVNDREIYGHVKNGRIVDAEIIDEGTPPRLDVVPRDFKEKNGKKPFVLGHKFGKNGEELNETAIPYAQMYNSGDPILKMMGERGILALLKEQPHAEDNPNPWDMIMADNEKNMKKYDSGIPTFYSMLPYSALPGLAEIGYNFAQWQKDKKTPARGYDPTVLSEAPSIISKYNPYVDVSDLLDAAKRVTRSRLHDAKQAGALSSGARMAFANLSYADYMNTLASIYANRNRQLADLTKDRTQLLAQYVDANAARQMQGLDILGKSTAQAEGAKYTNMDKHGTGMIKGFGNMMSNISTLQQFLQNVGLWREKLDTEKLQALNRIR